MDKTTTLMFRVACGMVIAVCGSVLSIPVMSGLLWVRGELMFHRCVPEVVKGYEARKQFRNLETRRTQARIWCSSQ